MAEQTEEKSGFVREGNIIKSLDQEIDVPFENTGEAILQTLRNRPDHIGQIEVETGKQTTYAEMEDKSIRCAVWMKKYGIATGDIVVICSDNHLDAYIPVFATFYLGAVYNAWNPYINLDLACRFMKLLRPKLIFICKTAVNILQKAAELENIQTKFIVFVPNSNMSCITDIMKEQTESEIRNFSPQKIQNPKDLGVIMFSSGSTAIPKGIMFSHKNFLKNMYSRPYSDTPKNRLWYTTLNWISSIKCTLLTVYSYDTRIIHNNPDVEEICKIIEKYKVTDLTVIPSLITYLASSSAIEVYDLSSLNSIFYGGAQPNETALETLRKRIPHVKLVHVYAMTEFGRSVYHSYYQCENLDSLQINFDKAEVKVTCLKTGETVGSNSIGELCLKSSTMMMGYYENIEATKKAFDKHGYLRSGDLGYYNEDCELFVVDRISELIEYKNQVISPNEIEQALMTNPAVVEAGVVPVRHKENVEGLVAFVKIIPGSNVTEQDLIELSSRLGEGKKLRGVIFLDNVPKLSAAKIDRQGLKRMAKNHHY